MTHVNLKTLCPLPWMHFSAHLDSTMRICCNTDGSGFVTNNEGKTLKLSDVESIQDYFNLDYYKEIRSKMMNQEMPEQCKKCYNVEKHGGLSVRQGYLGQYKDNPVFLENLQTTHPTGEITPKVQSLDFSLSNKCNLKCIMCSPDASYIIKPDWEKLEIPYATDFTEGAHKNWNNNPAFEKIIPEIAPFLEDMLTTGGEPFLNNEHFKILELTVKSGHAHKVNLTYHTNCTVKNQKLFDIWNEFKSVHLHFSIDAYGELNEYIRKNTKWTDVEKNVRLMIDHPKTHCEVHTTIQVLNIFNLPKLYEWISQFSEIPSLPFHIWMDHPTWLKINILPTPLKILALNNLVNFFNSTNKSNSNQVYDSRQKQIISYLKRALEEKQDKEGLALFKTRLLQFESIRNLEPIESIVPELKSLIKR